MFSYKVDASGNIISEHIGESVDGLYISDVSIDATKYMLINGVLVEKPPVLTIIRRYAQINNENIVVNVFDWSEELPPEDNQIHFFIESNNAEIGWEFSNGKLHPHVKTLEEAREEKKNELYTFFHTDKCAIVWADGYGYDANEVDISNFLAAQKRAEISGSSYYRVYRRIGNDLVKEFIPHTPEMFDSALIAGGIQQEAAYSKYLSKINDLNSAENIDSINLINWNN